MYSVLTNNMCKCIEKCRGSGLYSRIPWAVLYAKTLLYSGGGCAFRLLFSNVLSFSSRLYSLHE